MVTMRILALPCLFACAAVAQNATTAPPPAKTLIGWCSDLGDPDLRVAAAHRLWQTGPSTAPLLLREVQKSSAGAPTALQLLARFGRDAAPVAGNLRRLHGTGSHRHHDAIGLTLAAIGTRDAVTVSSYLGGYIVEFDADGKELRRVARPNVWGLTPLPGDRLLITTLTNSEVQEIDWDGKVHWRAKVTAPPLDAVRLPDGRTVVGGWNGKCVLWLDADGKEQQRLDGVGGVAIEPLFNGNLLICDYPGLRLVEVTNAAEVVWQARLPGSPMDVNLLPNGNYLVSLNAPNRIVEYERTADGLEVVTANDCSYQPEDVHRLADGRTFVTGDNGCRLLDATGRAVWKAATSHSAQAIVRLPSRH